MQRGVYLQPELRIDQRSYCNCHYWRQQTPDVFMTAHLHTARRTSSSSPAAFIRRSTLWKLHPEAKSYHISSAEHTITQTAEQWLRTLPIPPVRNNAMNKCTKLMQSNIDFCSSAYWMISCQFGFICCLILPCFLLQVFLTDGSSFQPRWD